ncbi:hypothetical protein [Vibrio parahaemolyticus]|uniref:hypothetical protein n=1 Tax=Vibrio parahaemolyticus TaxID=670 RepID=UPI003D7D776F
MNKNKVNKLSLMIGCILAVSTLSGCTSGKSIPKSLEEALNQDKITNNVVNDWKNEEPPIRFVPINDLLVLEEGSPIPDKFSNKNIKTGFRGSATLKDLVPILKQKGLYLVIPDADIRTMPIVMIDFDGKLGHLLDAFEAAYGINFSYHAGDIVTVEKLTSYQLRIPQDDVIAKQIQSDLKSMGAEEVSYSVNAATIFYKASKANHQKITTYLDRLTVNTSLVSMQVAIITVQVNRHKAEGIDWSKFGLKIGDGVQSGDTITTDDSSDDSSDSDSDNGNSTNPADELGSSIRDVKANASITGTSSALEIGNGEFTLSNVIDFLSTYGKAETSQSLIMKTLSGREVMMSVGDKVPYIDELSGTSDTESDSESSDVSVTYLDLGTKLHLKPWFDAKSQLVTIDFGMEISSLTKWVELNAGNQLGMVSQPQTREQKFSDVIKIMAGESVIIGGISFNEYSDDRNAPSFAEDSDIAYQKQNYSKNSTFIMIRPTVTIFGNR